MSEHLRTLRQLNAAWVQRLKWLLIALGLLPFLRLAAGVPLAWLGANPIEFITRSTGTWALVGLVVTLSITPLRRLTQWNWLIRLRRTAGLLSFFYAALHFFTYIWLDRFFDFADIVHDIGERPFIMVGFIAFVLLIPLVATSTNRAIKWVGGKNWQRLHYTVYLIAILASLHYLWLARRDPVQPVIYASIFGALFAARIIWKLSGRRG